MALARSLRSMIVSILIFMGASLKELGDQNKLALCLLPPFALQYGILSFFPIQQHTCFLRHPSLLQVLQLRLRHLRRGAAPACA